MKTSDWESKIPVHITDDAISWIGDGWRFYISNDSDDERPYWGFVDNHSGTIMESAFFTDEAIDKIAALIMAVEAE